MKQHWPPRPVEKQIEIQREMPKAETVFVIFDCLYGAHKAEVLHRGTAYCRACYNERNPFGKLVD